MQASSPFKQTEIQFQPRLVESLHTDVGRADLTAGTVHLGPVHAVLDVPVHEERGV